MASKNMPAAKAAAKPVAKPAAKAAAKPVAKAAAKPAAKREMMGPPAVIRGELGQKNDLRKKLIPAAAPKIRKDQNDFLRKVSATSYKMTAEEKKALASIREARANPSSGKVGAKIVGRKKVGEGRVGPKKAAPAKAVMKKAAMPKPGGSASGMTKRGAARMMM